MVPEGPRLITSVGRNDIAVVHILEYSDGNRVECVESLQPPYTRKEKWILLVSTLYGCPVGCRFCDAGGHYHGKLSNEEIFEQIDFLIRRKYPEGEVPCLQLKIQFSRMGEPALNDAVLGVLSELPDRYTIPGIMPSISTVAPAASDTFFEELLGLKNRLYDRGRFQFQFSLHSTDEKIRNEIIPIQTWSFGEMAAYGKRFFAPGDRKITLNFALARGIPLDPSILMRYFDPNTFIIKVTPLNPTYRAREHNWSSAIDEFDDSAGNEVALSLQRVGYEVILSIGELEENLIGSNCGQYLRTHLQQSNGLVGAYTYDLNP